MSGSDGILTSRCHEYYGSIPRKRWIITKLDLLCAQEVGYVLSFVARLFTEEQL